MLTKKLTIEGMSCNHCVKRVESALLDLEGLVSVKVNLSSKTAMIDVEDNFNDTLLFNAIDDAGYDLIQVELA
ncbi:MAG TPA: heavy metal transport/detoxification protein [Erysipelotrichaceae bacterium]|nr:heavy metal transport/detoxification protein [Erysipelotrichaceae bacterium]